MLWAAVVEVPESYGYIAIPWSDTSYGLNMRPAMRIATNSWSRSKGKVTPKQFLGEPKCWAVLDYTTLESPNVRGEVKWTASQAGTGHGFVVWFDTFLLDDVSLT